MVTWFTSLNVVDKIFLVCAILGGLLFVVRVVLMFVGGDGGGSDVHADVSGADAGGADVDHGGDHTGDADTAFRLLSLQGITAFFMMFGLVGLAMSRGSGLNHLVSLGGGLAAGLASVWVVDRLFRLFGKLQHSGTIDLRNAIGSEGTVYLTIPGKEPGKVRLEVQGHLKVLDAVSRDGGKIPTDARVKVVEVASNNVLVVTEI